MNFPIIDLHCDLLLYLTYKAGRTVNDPEPGCSLPQLQKGGVKSQVFAIFIDTHKGSSHEGQKQVDAFLKLREQSGSLNPLASIENLSGFFEEDEPLSVGIERLRAAKAKGIPFAYASLTWNNENRFGGGVFAPKTGIKDDGRAILEVLSELNIPVDLSHTSDLLAEDIFAEIDRQHLKLPIIASHSNSRKICNHLRNLPDTIASEIFKRGGIVGLNFVTYFVGGTMPSDLLSHYLHFCELGGKGQVCFGADFFYAADMPSSLRKEGEAYFSPYWENAECYPAILNAWIDDKQLSLDEAAEIAYKNARRFFIENTQITHI